VDEVYEPRQVVVKNLEENWRKVPGLNGVTVLRDGSLGFILDPVSIEQMFFAELRETAAEEQTPPS